MLVLLLLLWPVRFQQREKMTTPLLLLVLVLVLVLVLLLLLLLLLLLVFQLCVVLLSGLLENIVLKGFVGGPVATSVRPDVCAWVRLRLALVVPCARDGRAG